MEGEGQSWWMYIMPQEWCMAFQPMAIQHGKYHLLSGFLSIQLLTRLISPEWSLSIQMLKRLVTNISWIVSM
jgi:hypothetical protein